MTQLEKLCEMRLVCPFPYKREMCYEKDYERCSTYQELKLKWRDLALPNSP